MFDQHTWRLLEEAYIYIEILFEHGRVAGAEEDFSKGQDPFLGTSSPN